MDQSDESAVVTPGASEIPEPKGIKWIAALDFGIASLCFFIFYSYFEELIGTLFLALGLFHCLIAVYLLRRKNFYRKAQLVISFFHLLLIPIGTLLAPWVLWYLTRPHVKHAFGLDVPPEELHGFRDPALVRKFVVATILTPVVLFALAIPNLRLATRRGGQAKTMYAMRSIGTAVEAYAMDHNAYPPGSSTVADIEKHIFPKYIKELPRTDYWKNEYAYRSDTLSYTIASYGKDRMQDPVFHPGATTHFESDLVYSDGSFVSFSEGR